MDDQRRPWVVADSSTPDSAFARSSAPLKRLDIGVGRIRGKTRVSQNFKTLNRDTRIRSACHGREKDFGTIRYGLTAYR